MAASARTKPIFCAVPIRSCRNVTAKATVTTGNNAVAGETIDAFPPITNA